MNLITAFLAFIVKSSAKDIMLEPFLNTTGVVVFELFTTMHQSPTDGAAGNVKLADAVRIYVLLLTIVVAVETTCMLSTTTGATIVLFVSVSVPYNVAGIIFPIIEENVAMYQPNR